MSKEDLDNLKGEISKIKPEDIKNTTTPIDIYLQEAKNLCTWSLDDADHLGNINISKERILEINPRTGALRESESIWFKERFTKEEAQRVWLEESKPAYELRSQLLHDFNYAYRARPDISNRVTAIGIGNSQADMIQDLNDLAVLGRENSDELAAINFDLTLLDQAADLSDRLSDLLAAAKAENSNNGSKLLRDQAYTYLKEVVDEIRAAGQYLFWKNPERLIGYRSAYLHRINNARRRKKNEIIAD